MVDKILKGGDDVNMTGRDSRTALLIAAELGLAAVVVSRLWWCCSRLAPTPTRRPLSAACYKGVDPKLRREGYYKLRLEEDTGLWSTS